MIIRALLYKNWCIRKRYYIKTLFDILIPAAMILLLVYVKRNVGSNDSHQDNSSNVHNEVIFPEVSKNVLLNLGALDVTVLYTPNNGLTQSIMNPVNQILRFTYMQGFTSEEEIEKWIIDHVDDYYSFGSDKKYYGIIFDHLIAHSSNIKYTIRSVNPYIFDTGNIFPEMQISGPMRAGHVYLTEGFLQIKVAIDESFIDLLGLRPPSNWVLQEFPYPEYEVEMPDIFISLLPMVILFAFYMNLLTTVAVATHESASGFTERVKMSGASAFHLVLNWVIYSSMLNILSTLLASIFLTTSIIGSAVLVKSNVLIIWIFLILYCNASLFFMLAVSSVFTKAALATTMAFLSHFLLYISNNIFQTKFKLVFISKFFISFLPSCSLAYVFQTIRNLEASGEGATYLTLFTSISSEDLPLAFFILAYILSTLIYVFIYWFFLNVKPGIYGIPKPWHFFVPSFILSKFKFEEKPGLLNDGSYPKSIDDSKPLYEAVNPDLEIGLQLINMKKKYGNVTAVRNVSLDIYKGQITVLLGHNGAGKTTTMSMLSGMLKPSRGHVFYEGKNIYGNLEEYQKQLGLCTQHDLLHNSLTVWEHLVCFGLLKGLSKKEAGNEANSIMKKLLLTDKKNEVVYRLSGGMKRKLCLGIALVNSPNILILDEPSSGLDPRSKREIWNTLLNLRENRTFLLSTHLMEEADVLGDRIAIMDHGEIICYGSSLFLKKHYGAGYQLTIVIKKGSHNDIQSLVQRHIPNATVKSKTDDELTLTLPSTETELFPDLFKKLEKDSRIEIGISCSTMEDVFLKVGGHRKSDDRLSNTQPGEKNIGTTEKYFIPVFLRRFFALFVKNIKCTVRDWLNLLFLLICVLLSAFLTMYTTNGVLDVSKPALTLNLSIHGPTEVIVTRPTVLPHLFNYFNSVVRAQKSHLISFMDSISIIDRLLILARQDELKFRGSMILAAEFNSTNTKILYSSIALHAPAIAMNTYYNALLQSLTNSNRSSIETLNHPYKIKSTLCSGFIDIISLQIIWLIYFPIVIIFFMKTFVIKQHKENRLHLKHLQLMCEVSPFTYWFATFLVDLIVCCIYIICVALLIYLIDYFNLFKDIYLGLIIIVFFIFFFVELWFCYLMSFFFQSSSSAGWFFFFFSLILGYVGVILVAIPTISSIYTFLLKLNPLCLFFIALSKVIKFIMNNFICLKCSSHSQPNCSDGDFTGKLFVWDDNGINRELIFLLFDGILYAAIIFLVDFKMIPVCWNFVKSKYYLTKSGGDQMVYIETDVAKEKDAVDGALQENTNDPESPVVVVDGLVKKFSRSFTAVDGVSFTVRRGEVFGLLGVNGAGKSSTFNILTGMILPTAGNAYANGKSLRKNRRKYMSLIGYCPQFNGLFDDMTCYEHLKLFAILRGVPSKDVSETVLIWIQLLDLEEYTHVRSKKYSGGTKRKLNTAIALIGDPQVVILDEPTTGVDPVTRRNLWTVLKESEVRQQSIILSSHSMEECEAVCHRLTIMARGRMQCIGTLQHLKGLYGGGFTLFVKIKEGVGIDELSDLKNVISQTFGPLCILKDETSTLLQYRIDDSSHNLSVMFEKLEHLKGTKDAIDDYILNDTNLEQVFLSFDN